MNLRSHKALLIQGGKALVVLTLLGVPLIWPSAKPKTPPPTPTPAPSSPYIAPPLVPTPVTEAIPTKKEKKKAKKSKKVDTSVATNQLTNEAGRKLLHYNFTVPPELKPAVDFWKEKQRGQAILETLLNW